jgi:hypothetical protein
VPRTLCTVVLLISSWFACACYPMIMVSRTITNLNKIVILLTLCFRVQSTVHYKIGEIKQSQFTSSQNVDIATFETMLSF